MAVNLVSLVAQFVTPDMIAKIASYVGVDRGIAQKAVGGAIPALLAGLSDLSATPDGARQISNLTQRQADSLDSLKGLVGGTDQKSLVESGQTMLSGLFGGGALDAIAQSIGRYAGIGEDSGKSLIGMLAPLVLGALGQQQRSAGLDATGLASLLGSQRDQIAAAIPSGLADQLSTAGLDKFTGSLRGRAETVTAAGSRFAEQASRASRATPAAARPMSSQWAYWAAGLVIVGGLAWYLMARPGNQMVAETPPPVQTQTKSETVGLAPSDSTDRTMNLANQSVASLKSVLPGMTDAASAQAALPKLHDAISQLGQVKAQSDDLNPAAKATLTKVIAAAKPSIDAMCEKAMANPGVAPIAKPAIDELRNRLDTLTEG